MNHLFNKRSTPPHYVYIVKCVTGNHYVGCTNNLERRLSDHNKGKVKSTQDRNPVELISFIAFNNKYSAYHYEKYLKSGSGRAVMNKRFIEHAFPPT